MRERALMLDDWYQPNPWVAYGAAVGFHLFLFIWNPVVLKASAYHMAAPVIAIKLLDHMPLVQSPVPAVKPIQKKAVKKAKRGGLSMHHAAHPAPVNRHRLAARSRPAPRPFVSKITIPKYIPVDRDEPIAGSPIPGTAPAAPHPMTQALAPMPIMVGKTRGVRAEDISFKLSDRGALAASAEQVVAIPIGEERGDAAVLPSAPVIHEALGASKAIAGYRYSPGLGSGSGELVNQDRRGVPGYHGVVKANSYIEGSLAGAADDGRSGRVVSGKGFEIGGPVGDRKIIHRQLPEYPAWAEEKGVIAMVKIYFTVRPDGSLRSNIRVLRSSGYAELDDLAKQALLQWRFSPTSDGSTAESAWGVITFRFTLS
jgi:TonB family protein